MIIYEIYIKITILMIFYNLIFFFSLILNKNNKIIIIVIFDYNSLIKYLIFKMISNIYNN
jgi:hypothetical protein